MKNKTLAEQMAEILNEVSESVGEALDTALATVPAETSKNLRSNSPKQTGEYASGWRVKRSKKNRTATVYNAKMPGLTHLLENGHAIVNRYGKYGRVNGVKHIEPARDAAWDKVGEVIDVELSKDGIK